MSSTIMSSYARSIGDHLRKPGGGIYGWMVKRFFKKQSRPLEKATVMHCKIQPNESVLELGFGSGFGIQYAAQLVKNGSGKVYGIDFSPVMMTEAMELLKEEISSNKVQLTLGDVSDLPYRDDSIDKVFHCNCYYFWDDRQKVLNNIHRILRPGGLMITVLNRTFLQKMIGKGFLTEDQIDHERYINELGNHFCDVDISDFNFRNSEKKYQVIRAFKSKISI
ncbi:Sterol 24-C-methyltransferase [Holothuria leucospilota]|uniref:Sterol 24-C-methyltransferase n=1 Tax=Holothuria leucospilota TaxID=206669 RepID=A0A9Q0YGS1_HOLLE|nr:Sterol 24-C-methyltransferase [Holothuria leucospilota]